MDIIKFNEIEEKIFTIRDEKVILDSDLAILYGVETRDINKAVKNNPDKFPDGYIFELTKFEKDKVVENFHNLDKVRFSPHLPKAFTEKGLYMLATILKSTQATQTTIAIIETYAKIKNLTQTIKELTNNQDEKTQKTLLQKSSGIIADILDDSLHVDQSETIIEINLALLKVKHTVKRK